MSIGASQNRDFAVLCAAERRKSGKSEKRECASSAFG